MGLLTIETDSKGHPLAVQELPSHDRRYRRIKIGRGVSVVCRKCKGCDIRVTCRECGNTAGKW